MNAGIDDSINICNQLINLLEDDYKEIHKHMEGEIYDAYKQLILDEIERVENIKRLLKTMR